MRRFGLCLVVALASHKAWAESPPVKVELRTSWAPPPYVVEVLETLSLEEPHAFFPVLNALTNSEWLPSVHTTDEQTYRKVLEVALGEDYLAFPGELASFNAMLALHSANPRLQAAYQYYLGNHGARNHACGSWVDWYGEVICDKDTLRELVSTEAIEAAAGQLANSSYAHPTVLPFDHVNPSADSVLDRPPRTAILYASLDSPNFRDLHEFLYEASNAPTPHVEYVLRHVPPKDHASNEARTFLSGYGVALDLKKMDYLALDDRRQGGSGTEGTSKDASKSTLEADPIVPLIQQYPEAVDVDYSTPLTKDELLEISIQAAQLIGDSEDKLATLKQLSQSFPKYASSIARRVTVNEGLAEEVQSNMEKVQGGINAVWLNGAPINDDNMNPFSLLRLMRKERATMMSLLSLGLKESHAIELLTHRAVGLAQSDTGVLDGIFDASDRPERGNVIVYWNDIENDAKYARWHPSVSVLLNPMYPGQLPNARLNLWNVVFALDLSTPTSVNVIGGPIATIIARGFPFRLGVVPLFTNPESEKMARLMYWLVDQFGSEATLSWFFKVSRRHAETGSILALDWSIISAEFGHFIEDHRDTLSEDVVPDFDAIITGEDEDLARRLDKARAYAERLNLDPAEAPQGHFFVNGKHFVLDDNFMRSTQMIAGQQLQHLQEQLYFGNITEDDAESISTYFYDLPEASRRRNKFIYPSTKPGSLRIENLVDLVETSDLPFSPGSFVYPPESERVPITTIVVADLDSPEGIQFVQEALLSLKDNSLGRLTFIHNPSSPQATESHTVSSVLGHLIFKKTLAQASPATLLEVLGFEDGVASREPSGQTVVLSPRLEQIVMAAEEKLGDLLDGAPLSSPDDETYAAFVMASRFVVRKLKLQPGDQAIIVNGRVVGPLAPGDLIAEDIEQLLAYENRKRVGPVVQALEDVVPPIKQYGRDAFAQAVSLASSVISSIHLPDASEVGLFNAPLKPRRRNYQLLGGQYVKSEFGDNSTALYHFGILLDPISEAAQKWSSLLEWLINDPSVYLELYLNPNRYEEIPLKRFYRYNLNSVPQFNEQGEESRPQVVFDALPEEPIYTLAMDIAPSWMVRPREATYDLDNILLSALSENERAHGVYALFDLDYLVIEGHAREGTSMSPPRGLQLQLVAPRADGVATNETTTVDPSAPIADTLVVANLGYLQFRAKPGVFRLEIRPGRGREIFALDSVGGEGWESPSVEDGGDAITLMSFEGLTLYPRTARLPGMEEADVLAIDEPAPEDEGIVGKLKTGFSSLFGSKPQADIVPATGDGEADINIFTVASGLLYERFASIMILSVLRNTKGTVKFWFIENFLSPSFLEFIPHFAAEYNFQYELVTYKWPTWLRAQKEKQRTIWGYKILFLDVLFPMSLKKVIFVDADQIVRADLRELVDLDLHGAPYAYTPMGDDNTDMEGFRFWKTGYWKDFLGPLKYHISALYVVDLVRFRQMAAGDMLRAHYQGLSADPNSLANLDQDLPNNLQREVPIFSLNEDWLWCETWCSKNRLDRAKTIDLCQNPLTKEPKLARAKHIPEWESYDSEIARFAHSLAERGVIRAGMADADATKLAEVGAAKAESHPGVEGDGEGADKIQRPTAEGRPKDEL